MKARPVEIRGFDMTMDGVQEMVTAWSNGSVVRNVLCIILCVCCVMWVCGCRQSISPVPEHQPRPPLQNVYPFNYPMYADNNNVHTSSMYLVRV